MIAPGLTSERLTDLLLVLLRRFDPERHDGIQRHAVFGGADYVLELRETHEFVSIPELKGKLTPGDLEELAAADYIRVHQRDDGRVGAFRLTPRAHSLLAASISAQEKTAGVAADPTIQSTRGAVEQPAAWTTGSMIGSFYVLGKEIGQGGMGTVFMAQDTRLDRPVAIKVVHEKLAGDDQAVQRFEREARALARLRNPWTVMLLEIGQHGGQRFLVFEYLEGPTLKDVLEGGSLNPRVALGLLAQIARSIWAAHKEGVLHRDLKPGNVVVIDGVHAKVIDFGLASVEPRNDETPTQVTKMGEVHGTPGYMAPELLDGERADQRADIFAFGVIAYHLLAGKYPFGKPTRTAVLSEATPLSSVCPGIPSEVASLVDACLSKAKAKRPEDLSGVLTVLDSVNSGGIIGDDSKTASRLELPHPSLPSPATALDVVLDVADPHCLSHNFFAVRVEKRGQGRADRVSLVLDSCVIDGNRQASAPNLRFPVHGGPDAGYVADISPGVPQYFQLLRTAHHAGNRELGHASWQLTTEGRFPMSNGKQLEIVVKIQSDFELPRFRLRFAVSPDAGRQLQFTGIERVAND